MYQILIKANYFVIENTVTNEIYQGHTKDVVIRRQSLLNDTYEFSNVKTDKSNLILDLSQFVNENYQQFTHESFANFYTSLTGKSSSADNSIEVELFDGNFALNNTAGVYYKDKIQTAPITFGAQLGAIVGGHAIIHYTSNGNAIDIPTEWENVSGNNISTTAGDVNFIIVLKTVTKIKYAIKVN